MVIIACLISNGYDVLVCNSLDPFEKTPYMLPESSAESIEVAQKNITERLGCIVGLTQSLNHLARSPIVDI